MKELLIFFIICNIINVMLQTIKSLATIHCKPFMAALMNATAYGFYTYIIIITNCDLPTWQKMVIVGACNLIGVYVVKFIERKMKKDKLWKVEATIKHDENLRIKLVNRLDLAKISFNYIDIGQYFMFNLYLPTQEQSKEAKKILEKYGAKFFVSESKVL